MRLDWTPPTPIYPQYADLRAAAEQAARGFVDPATVYRPDEIARRRGYDWVTAVIGRPYHGVRSVSVVEARLIDLADAAGVDPALPQWLVDERAETAQRQRLRDDGRAAARRRDEQAWAIARQGCPVAVEVRPNLTAQVRNSVREHLGHVVPLADAMSGRSRRHAAGRALCETANRRPMRLGEPTSDPATCMRCLQWAPKVRGAEPAGEPATVAAGQPPTGEQQPR